MSGKINIYILLMAASLFHACAVEEEKKNRPSQAAMADAALSVEGMILKASAIDDKIYSTGTLLPNEEVELRPETSGRIVGIYFEEGSRVSKGQLLAKIDNSELNAQLNKLKVQRKLAQSEEARQQKLLDIEAISQGEYDVTLNQLNTLEAEIDLIETQISKTNITSPFSGIVSLRNVSEGGYVSPSTLIASMQQIDPIKVEFSVPERYISDIKEGTVVNYGVTNTNDTYQAKVYAIDSKIDVNTRTVRVRARSSNPENSLRPGAFARVEIILKSFEDAILVPSDAILTELEGEKVFITENGKATSKRVRTGIRNENMVQILEGLALKDTLVLTGLMSIQEGKPIEFKELRSPDMEVKVNEPNVAL
ncbi:efflux RND transporter periplasmic adaptor subunit [Catalinimonas niigatensis]|uniref:efflux RND transporter periplasmic adaptor subunit n=1 Tax=Catalinimonas niigatensis TaxID=1397264 RepID=UPI0026665457|nr:efflux RND transporter periplasmic adaptor subunit [Catalinimonas niigatensis]WPP53289.1 efflux RND transporter periplasmic adaptor subunit [Catalinimonas niigatensis]